MLQIIRQHLSRSKQVLRLRHHRFVPLIIGFGFIIAVLGLPLSRKSIPIATLILEYCIDIILIISSLISIRYQFARLIASAVFFLLAWFDLGQYLAGHLDCGCFRVAIPPSITAIINLGLSVGFFLIYTSSNYTYSVNNPAPLRRYNWSFFIAFIIILLGTYVGWSGRIVARQDRMVSAVVSIASPRPNIKVGDTLPFPSNFQIPETIVLYRSSCDICRRYLPIIRVAETGNHTGFHSSVEIDLDENIVRLSDLLVIEDPGPFYQLMRLWRKLTIPAVIHNRAGKILSVRYWASDEDSIDGDVITNNSLLNTKN